MKYSYLLSLLAFALLISCNSNPYQHGEILYGNFCASCHMDDGSGLEGNIPPLAGADYVAKYNSEMACVIRYGLQGEILVNGKRYNNPMPGIEELSDFEITNIINYINHAWGNDFGYIQIDQVRTTLENCEDVQAD
jgi:mono/diheme cytochrome c family protein